jgi:hypothetical protein
MPVDILWISKIALDMFLNFSNDMARPKRLFHSPVNCVDKNTGPSLHWLGVAPTITPRIQIAQRGSR